MFKKCYPGMLLLATFFSVFTSCGKEESAPNEPERTNKLTGTYDFVGVSADIVQTVTSSMGSDVMKAVMTTHYDSKENTGVSIITGSTIQNNGFGYKVEATSQVKYYFNGSLTDDETLPMSETVPASSNSLTYRLKGADSIYTTGGVPPVTHGARYYWKSDTLILVQRIKMDAGDAANRTVADINTVTKLKRRK